MLTPELEAEYASLIHEYLDEGVRQLRGALLHDPSVAVSHDGHRVLVFKNSLVVRVDPSGVPIYGLTWDELAQESLRVLTNLKIHPSRSLLFS